MTTEPKNAVRDDGTILLYGVIGDEWDGLDAKTIIEKIADLGEVDTLTVRINSGGGLISHGLAIYNYLAGHPAQKVVLIDGVAASMASVIAMVGDRIVMPENAVMMIHNPWNIAIGDAEVFRKEADKLDLLKNSIVGIYANRTGLEREAISQMMDDETWMSGEEAVDLGFATESADPIKTAALARIGLAKFRRNPPHVPARAANNNQTAVMEAAAMIDIALAGPTAEAPEKGESQMPEKKSAAEKKTADIVSNADPNGADPAPVTAAQISEEAKAAAEAAVKADRKRQAEIRALCAKFGLDNLANELCESDATVDQARAKIIDALAQADAGTVTRNHVRVSMGDDAADRFVKGATAALMARAGLPGGERNEFTGLTLRELARESLEVRNVSVRGLSAMDMVKAAFLTPRNAITHSTSDFTLILANVAEKSMMRGYEEAQETFPRWTATGVLGDFKPANRVDLNAFPSLREVRPGAEYKYATIGERGETIVLATYGELFSITRQSIINDDLSVFTRIPQRMGRAAIRTVGDLVYAILIDNPTMSDGVALFHANHGNLAGSGAAPSTATFDAARTAMATQKDRSGNATALNIRPAFFIGPVALEGQARVVVESETEIAANQNNSRRPNSVRNMVEVVTDARLDAASTAAWYMAANPQVTDTIEVAYLDGVQTPTLEQMEGWKVDGVEFKVRIDAGAKALAWEGVYKNPGNGG